MASRPAIESRVEGLEASRRALERILRAEVGAIPEALEIVGQVATTEIKRRAPLLTGRLRRSYTYDVDSRGRWVEISSNVEYAPYQEFGTRRIEGTPHVRPGIEATTRQIPRILAEGMARAGRGAAPRAGMGARGRLATTATTLAGG